MKKICSRSLFLLALLLAIVFIGSCGSPDSMIFSLREGIGHFSMEYPPEYQVIRIDIRNEATSQYTDIGLRAAAVPGTESLGEISVYIWPAAGTETATAILDYMLFQAEDIFPDYKLLDTASIMVGDMEGQAARFSWNASPDTSSGGSGDDVLPAISRIVCFRHNDLAWEIHVATDAASQAEAEDVFLNIIETFQILN
jgi:hypothetical protein